MASHSYRPWGLHCQDWAEAHKRWPFRAKLHDLIINALPLASVTSALLDSAVQSLEKVRCDEEVTSTRVHQVEGTPVPLDLLLRAIARRRVAKHERPEPSWFNDDPLDTIGRFHFGELLAGLF
jgi:hypothetical protein